MLKKRGKNDCKRFQKTEKNTSFSGKPCVFWGLLTLLWRGSFRGKHPVGYLNPLIYLKNRFHVVAAGLISNKSMMTWKRGMGKKFVHEAQSCVSLIFLTTFWHLLWSLIEKRHETRNLFFFKVIKEQNLRNALSNDAFYALFFDRSKGRANQTARNIPLVYTTVSKTRLQLSRNDI